MSKVGFVFLMLTQIFMLVLIKARAQEYYSQAPLELKSDKVYGSSEPLSLKNDEKAEAPDIRRMGKHHSSDMAGGGVIIGGLVTATFAVVFCYLRVTRKIDNDAAGH